nr:PAS domain S-box protein [Candidatus Hydrogenedentota bacterium]
ILADFAYEWEYWLGPDGSPVYVSPSCERITGYCRQAFYDRPSLLEEIVHPDDRKRARGFVFGRPDAHEAALLEFRIIDVNGQEHWLAHASQPVHDNDGHWAGRRASNRVITDQKRAEELVQELSQWRDALLESANILVCVQDLDGRFLIWNNGAERITEYPRDAVLGSSSLLEVLFAEPADWERSRALLLKAAREESAAHQQFEIRTKSGRPRTLACFSKPILDVEGAPAGALILGVDITRQKRVEIDRRALEAQIQQTQKRESLAVMAGGIAHDFNNLLMGILGNAGIVLEELPEDTRIRKNVTQIEKTARRAADLIRQMLAYSGKGRFVIETLNLNIVLQDMLPLLTSALSKKAELVFDLAPNLPYMDGDTSQLRQLIMNLAMNASEALEDRPGVITLRTGMMYCSKSYLGSTYLDEEHTEGDFVYFEITDTGCGMSEETQATLFDPFFSTKFTGRGLGLAAALGIIHGHRGAVKVDSKPGQGTTVRALFPCGTAVRPGAQRSGAAAAQDAPQSTVLVIDDEEAARLVAQEMLERSGYRVLAAADGCEGLQQYQKTPRAIDVVLLDLTMPHLDGEETFHRIRAIRPDARVVLTSGYDEHEVARRFHGLGLAGFLQKPYTPTELRSKIAEALSEKA